MTEARRHASSGAPAAGASPPLPRNVLEVESLTCEIPTPYGSVRPVDRVSFVLERGTTLGIVGESGSGKSMLVRALMGLSPPSATVTGKVLLDGTDLHALRPKELRHRLGSGIGMVFQDPMTSLNPVVPIGRQITEGMRFHLGLGRKESRERATELLAQVGISNPRERLSSYPYQLSGGMRQRVTIAAALACDPEVLIADEATTALDVTVQKQILDLLQKIQAERNMSVILISHDLGVVAGRADNIAVMYVGQIAETGPTRAIFGDYRHRYTAALLRSMPTLDHEPHTILDTIPGGLPSLAALPKGCRYAARCEAATDDCRAKDPEPTYADDQSHWYRCFWPVGGPSPDDGGVP